MSKTTQRREKKEADRFREMAMRDPEQFKRAWARRIRAWVMEVISRARAWNDEAMHLREREPVFGVLEKAHRMLDLCGEDVRRQVGAETRCVVESECCKAFAALSDPRLYRMDRNRFLL